MTQRKVARRDPVATLVERWSGEETFGQIVMRLLGKERALTIFDSLDDLSSEQLAELADAPVGWLRRHLSITVFNQVGRDPRTEPQRTGDWNIVLQEFVAEFYQRLGEAEHNGTMCGFCWGSMTPSTTRPRLFCSNRCRQAAWRKRHRPRGKDDPYEYWGG